jgi:Signal recognition particle GTPase
MLLVFLKHKNLWQKIKYLQIFNYLIAIIIFIIKQERFDPIFFMASRKIRISKGSGIRVQDVNKLLKQFLQSQKMMKRMKSMGKG